MLSSWNLGMRGSSVRRRSPPKFGLAPTMRDALPLAVAIEIRSSRLAGFGLLIATRMHVVLAGVALRCRDSAVLAYLF
jgi:hypothetical protein